MLSSGEYRAERFDRKFRERESDRERFNKSIFREERKGLNKEESSVAPKEDFKGSFEFGVSLINNNNIIIITIFYFIYL